MNTGHFTSGDVHMHAYVAGRADVEWGLFEAWPITLSAAAGVVITAAGDKRARGFACAAAICVSRNIAVCN